MVPPKPRIFVLLILPGTLMDGRKGEVFMDYILCTM
jgi:hypothetical protein